MTLSPLLLRLFATLLAAGTAAAGTAVEPPKPTLAWASQPTYGGETVLLWGSGLAGIKQVTITQVGCADLVSDPPTVAAPFDISPTALKVTLPTDLPYAHYKLCVTPSSCIDLNTPDLWWRRGDVNLTHATAGTGWVRIFGRGFGNLSAAEPSRLPAATLRLSCVGSVVTDLHAVNGSSNDAFFQLPHSIQPGRCTLSIVSCGAVFPVASPDSTLQVLPAGTPKGTWAQARSQEVIEVNTTIQLFAALNTSQNRGGAMILLARGVYLFTNESVSLPPFTVLRGATNSAGEPLATLRWDVRELAPAAVPKYFVGGNATFAVEDLTIYTLGLYNKVITDSHLSSHVRIARVRRIATVFELCIENAEIVENCP